MRRMRYLLTLASLVSLVACSTSPAPTKYPATADGLRLSRVVLYRNGIGYFERVGTVEGDILRIRIRKDQVNDLLKSLTIVEKNSGRAVSVSMPLDPQTWANAALATLSPGSGSLAQVLDALRGTHVVLTTTSGDVEGRIAMVEPLKLEPKGDDDEPRKEGDHRITLLDEQELRVVRLSEVEEIMLEDGDLALQFHRALDASAGEGMFQQVDASIRLAGDSEHELLVSYVAPAPMWKPTYRLVLPETGKGKALLQGWAVVDNTSGEEWREVALGLTSGAPIAFRYDLHTPREVERTDLTETGVRKRARVAVGETSYEQGGEDALREVPAEASDEEQESLAFDEVAELQSAEAGAGAPRMRAAKRGAPAAAPSAQAASPPPAPVGAYAPKPEPEQAPMVDFDSLRRSTLASARASAVSGLTRFDLEHAVTVPEGTSTMVAIINHSVEGEETFLFRPGGAGTGYEANPYRVVRFRNTTPFVLEPGPIAIYAGGSFVGEGLSETIGTNTSATIPFAVEPGILVSSQVVHSGEEMHLIRIVRGVLEVETFARQTTKWTAKTQVDRGAFTVFVRHPKAGWNYTLKESPEGVEELPDAYLVPVRVPASKREATAAVVEETPSRTSISIWEGRAIPLLEKLLVGTNLGPEARAQLEPIVRLRQEIGRIDTMIEGLKKQREDLDQRADQTRQNLDALKKDPAAGALRARLSNRLEEFTQQGDKVGREIVELQSQRLEKKIELEDLLQNLDLRAPEKASGAATPPK